MAKCWEQRGCDEEMQSRCPHAVQSTYHPCPLDCKFTVCDKPQHKQAVGWELLLDPTVDRAAAIKEACRCCEFFLNNGPRLA